MRGKLVPQNPHDIPASVLLEKIAEEKARLVKDGIIRSQKKLPEISDDEKPYKLPKGWVWARLTQLYYSISPAGKKLMSSEIKDSGEYPVVDQGKSYIAGYTNNASLLIEIPGPVIVFGDHTTEKKYIDFNFVAGADGTKILRPYKMAERYFHIYLLSYKQESRGYARHFKVLNNNLMALPPLSEQHRIVTKIDELVALCDKLEQEQTNSNATHQTLVETLLATLTNATDQEVAEAWQRIANQFDTLFTTEHSIDQLKQTILQLAVMGKLVPQDPANLPAPQAGKFFVYALECEDKSIYIGQTGDILKRWKEHAAGKGAEWTKKNPPLRLVHWEEYNSREEAIKREKELKTGFGRKWIKRELAAGRTRQAGEPASVLLERIAKDKTRLIKEGKIKKQKLLPEITEDEKLFELPEGWEWARLQQIIQISSGDGLIAANMNNEGWISVFGGNGITGYHDQANVAKPTLVIGRVGYYCGSIHITPAAAWITDNAFETTFSEENIYIDFLYWLLKGTNLKENENATAHSVISGRKVYPIVVGLPPTGEQRRIVAKVDELMAICDALKDRFNDAQTTQVQLADAIVEQAVA